MNKRQESIKRIKTAYNKGYLGFQRNANSCLYYEKATNSCCAVGAIFIDVEKDIYDKDISELKIFGYDSDSSEIDCILQDCGLYDGDDIDKLSGLYYDELCELQTLHDCIVNCRDDYGYKQKVDEFEDFLFKLE